MWVQTNFTEMEILSTNINNKKENQKKRRLERRINKFKRKQFSIKNKTNVKKFNKRQEQKSKQFNTKFSLNFFNNTKLGDGVEKGAQSLDFHFCGTAQGPFLKQFPHIDFRAIERHILVENFFENIHAVCSKKDMICTYLKIFDKTIMRNQNPILNNKYKN